MKKFFLLALALFSTATLLGQRRFQESNAIGIMGGVNYTTLETSNFSTKPELGWNGGLQVRGNFYNDFDMVYAIQFSGQRFSVATLNGAMMVEDVTYTISGGQVSLMLSYKIVENYLSVEAGPVFQFNGKMALDERHEQNTIAGTTLKAVDIVDINPFNLHAAVGFTAGVKHVRLSVQYLYGINNVLNNLNGDNLGYDFKGRLGIVSGNIVVYL